MKAARSLPATILGMTCLVLAAAGCGTRKPPVTPSGAIAEEARIGVYRARATDGEGRSRRFRLHVFAAAPDRLHAEVVAPVGGTKLVVDGGGGRLAVTVVADRIAFVGPSDREAMERIFGLRLSLENLVDLLLTGSATGVDLEFRRDPAREPGLPRSLEVEGSGMRLSMELARIRPLKGGAAERLGTGTPPERAEVLPLEELEPEAGPLLFPAEGGEG